MLEKVFFGFALGAIFGSFLNMLIYRVTNNVSLKGRSFCPNCKKVIPWYENIPIISYIILRGRCSKCGYEIPKYYFFNEVFLAFLGSFLAYKFPNLKEFFISFLFFTFFHYMAVLDYLFMEIDIRPAYFGSLILLFYKVYPFKNFYPLFEVSFVVFLLYYLKEGYFILKGKEGLGEGDITLCAYITSYFGLYKFFLILSLGASLIIIHYILLKILKKENNKFPLVPYLYIASLILLLKSF